MVDIRIEYLSKTQARVIVDGHELSGVKSYSIDHEPAGLPCVTLVFEAKALTVVQADANG
jgi:hypothetical protein